MKRIRKLIICFYLILSLSGLLIINASAEIVCSCSESRCICFVQMGDEGLAVKGIMERLYLAGYLKSSRGSEYDRTVYEAVCRFQSDCGIEQTGMMDDDTLTYLLWNQPVHELDEEGTGEVWIPTDGGKKRHAKQGCSGMYDPRKMSVRNARELGLDPCKRCKPE